MSNPKTQNINNYLIASPWPGYTGNCEWGIGTRGGRSYFLKKFQSPSFPLTEDGLPDETKRAKLKKCRSFEQKKLALYRAVHESADGNIVETHQFFRSGTKYYSSTEAVMGQLLSIEQIAALPYYKRLQLCCQVAYSFACLHAHGVVHSDVKPDNILVVNEKTLRGRVIDFDAAFLEEDPPSKDEEVNGDLVYFSPEICLRSEGIEVPLTCKMDIFALAIVFHQYLTGKLPGYDAEQYPAVNSAILNEGSITLDEKLDGEIKELLREMLHVSPDKRPDAHRVFEVLQKKLLILTEKKPGVHAGDSMQADPANPHMRIAGDL